MQTQTLTNAQVMTIRKALYTSLRSGLAPIETYATWELIQMWENQNENA